MVAVFTLKPTNSVSLGVGTRYLYLVKLKGFHVLSRLRTIHCGGILRSATGKFNFLPLLSLQAPFKWTPSVMGTLLSLPPKLRVFFNLFFFFLKLLLVDFLVTIRKITITLYTRLWEDPLSSVCSKDYPGPGLHCTHSSMKWAQDIVGSSQTFPSQLINV